MSALVNALSASPVLRGATPAELAAIAPLFHERKLTAREVLWSENDLAEELALVVRGMLEVLVGSRRISTIGPGELVGEASAFIAEEVRTSTIRAIGPAELLLLSRGALATLRASHGTIYDLLLAHALRTLASRVETTLARLSELSHGKLARASAGAHDGQKRRTASWGVTSPIPAMRPRCACCARWAGTSPASSSRPS